MTDILASIGEVVNIVEGISTASQEQAVGVQEINSSVSTMDEMTQQNSALVEQSTASARALSDQSRKLAEIMTFFRVDDTAAYRRVQPTAHRAAKPVTVTKAPAMASADDDGWNEF